MMLLLRRSCSVSSAEQGLATPRGDSRPGGASTSGPEDGLRPAARRLTFVLRGIEVAIVDVVMTCPAERAWAGRGHREAGA
jgi:hypothetical protein